MNLYSIAGHDEPAGIARNYPEGEMSMTTQTDRPRIQSLDEREHHGAGATGHGGSGSLPDVDIAALLSGIPDQRTGSRPRRDLSKNQVERIIGALLEVHGGLRAVAQLTPWLSSELATRMRDDTPRNRPRYQLQSAHLCRSADDSLEVAATARARARTVAVTARFERRDRQWRCSQFAVLDPRTA
ncbi:MULTISPECIES: Rv3235 family protein [Prauserella salsuginis group]|uniref:Rv3235 family protein n=1 Tax=Prauserella salsuginis TaxID=387889 RepID=A0ABW6GA01_9PSEU|nr:MULTISPECIES: Rv3235 family protein [Prauserella salsuginis group]